LIDASIPRWFRPFLVGLTAVFLLGWFSPEISDPDFWWHLRTGQYVVDNHSLPVPDPFAFTSSMGQPAYPGEPTTRRFNLTHEWLAQVLFYLTYRTGGFPGVVLFRALLLAITCAIVSWIVHRRTRGFYRALAAGIATAGVLQTFAVDRPFLFTFLLLAATIAIADSRRHLWVLPVLILFWANCHGGFFLGWVALAAYSAEELYRSDTAKPPIWLLSLAAIVASGLNPNGFRIPQILGFYRSSYLTSTLLEWAPTPWWPLRWYTCLLIGALVVMVLARKKVRPVDWLLLAAFAIAALTAYRNVALIGIFAPIVIASYIPLWTRANAHLLQYLAPVTVAAALVAGIFTGSFFQLRVDSSRWPSGAAAFLATHGITQPLFNTYEFGGYLIWRLWPEEKVFIDGRSLNESVFQDYARILYNHDETGGKSAQQLLDQYGVEAILMNGFEFNTGNLYKLAPSLADPQQTAWKLVYTDGQAMVFLRHPFAGIPVLSPPAVFDGLEAQCHQHIDHDPQTPRCARSLGQVFTQVGQYVRARRWIGKYLSLPHDRDPEAEEAYRKLLGATQ